MRSFATHDSVCVCSRVSLQPQQSPRAWRSLNRNPERAPSNNWNMITLWKQQPGEALHARFAWSAGGVLAITALAKVFSAIGPARALDAADPLIGIPFRQLFLLVGVTELLIAFFCLFTDRRLLSVWLVAWLSSSFFLYRLGLWFLGWHHPCGCMGSLAGMLHLLDRAADNIMKGVLAYLLIASYGILLWQWRAARGVPAPLKET